MENRTKNEILLQSIAKIPVYKFLQKLDAEIARNFRAAGVSPRPVQANGLWCCLLIPCILVIYTLTCKVPKAYTVVAFISIGLLAYSLLFSLFVYLSCIVLQERTNGGVTAAVFIGTITTYMCLDYSLTFCLSVSIFAVVSYYCILHSLITKIQSTFTLGEAMVLAQGIVLVLTYYLVNLYFHIFQPTFMEMNEDMLMINKWVITAISTVGLIVTALYWLDADMRDMHTLTYILSCGALYALIAVNFLIGLSAIPRLIRFVFRDKLRIKLFWSWLFLVAAAILVLVGQTSMKSRADSAGRKAFHLLAAAVFLTGIASDLELMALAAGIGLALIILVEALRLSGIEPVSSMLQQAFEVYCDEKDVGKFAMTPVYLYVGLACPLVLVPWRADARLELLSGVLAIGVGDSAASWFGARYGQIKWPNSKKTVEGTVCSIVSQIAAVYMLSMFGVLEGHTCVLLRTAFVATVNSLVEAQTDQVDNLILPLITILAFQPTAWLRS